MVGFRLEDPVLRNDFSKYFQMKTYLWHWDIESDTTSYIDAPTEKCTKEHFGVDDSSEYDLYRVNQAYCIKKDFEYTLSRDKH